MFNVVFCNFLKKSKCLSEERRVRNSMLGLLSILNTVQQREANMFTCHLFATVSGFFCHILPNVSQKKKHHICWTALKVLSCPANKDDSTWKTSYAMKRLIVFSLQFINFDCMSGLTALSVKCP